MNVELSNGIAFVVCNKKMRKYIDMSGTTEKTTRGRPEIDRFQLRQLLIRSLDERTVKWSSRLRDVDEKDGKLTLNFDHGTETDFDLIIGADGAWSRVRPLLSDIKPFYTGVGGFHWSIQDPKEKHPDEYALVNRGSMFAFSEGKGIFAQQQGNGSLGVSSYAALPETWQQDAKYDIDDGEAVKAALLEQHQDWAPELKKFIDSMDTTSLAPRNLYMLPVGNKWKHKAGATLLGDAAHLMSPFAGEGVNVAMKDALDLSDAIIGAAKSGDLASLDGRVQKFERIMFKRSEKVQQITCDMMNAMFFTPGAPDKTIEKYICSAVAQEMNPVLGALTTAVIYSYFFFFRLLGMGGGYK